MRTATGLLIILAACASPAGAPAVFDPATRAPYYTTLDSRARTWVDETLSSLTLRERIGQLVVPWIPGSYASSTDPEFLEIERWVAEEGIGGVAISIGLPLSYASKLNRLQDAARVPLLVTSDFENGGPGMRINHSYALPSLLPQGGGTSFPPTMAFGAIGDPEYAYEYGRITALEARALGVHLNFAPVLDVNSNPDNPIINTRSFGEDPSAVAGLGIAYIRGAREGGVLTTAKHFPGHGDTRTDSHIELPVVTADRDRLDTLELVPFRAAVDEGVDAVMTAHVAVPAVLGPDAPPATLSPYFLTDLLREEMGFRGLLFTDALRMGAITRMYGSGEASVLALEAGSDVILVPEDVGGAIEAVEAAVLGGRITRARVDESVRRILEMKARVGLHERRRVDLDAVTDVVGSGTHLAYADGAAARSITLPRDRDGLVPLDVDRHRHVLSVTYARTDDPVAGREFDRVAAQFVERLETVHITDASSRSAYESVRAAAGRGGCRPPQRLRASPVRGRIGERARSPSWLSCVTRLRTGHSSSRPSVIPTSSPRSPTRVHTSLPGATAKSRNGRVRTRSWAPTKSRGSFPSASRRCTSSATGWSARRFRSAWPSRIGRRATHWVRRGSCRGPERRTSRPRGETSMAFCRRPMPPSRHWRWIPGAWGCRRRDSIRSTA